MEKDAFYFPHFCNARQDRKIKRVRKELGLEGYGIYFMLLETLREQQEFKFPMEDIDLLADEFGTSEQKLRTVICNYELFQVDEEQNFFSVSFIKYLTPYLEGKQRKRISGIKGNLVKYGYATKKSLENLSDLEILELNENKQLLPKLSHCESHSESLSIRTASQSKEKESKEKESKENKKSKNKQLNKQLFSEELEKLNLSEFLKESFKEWFDYKEEIKNPVETMLSITKTLNQLGKDYIDEKHLCDSIDFSIAKGYKGIFPKEIKQQFTTVSKQKSIPVWNV